MKVIRYSLPATVSAPLAAVGNKSFFVRSALWYASMRRIANKVVTDRPRGERFSRFVAAALVWRQARA
jgi:hypothetical protein